MSSTHKVNPQKKYYFTDTSFNTLMKKRIYHVLLICSKYDAFILEGDGRIDEQIFNEYVSLNLRYPPRFIQAHSAQKAFEILEEEPIDLVITMLSVGDMDTFDLAKKVKVKYPKKPIVVLTPFSRDVTLKINKEDLSVIDYIFCWLGNTDILVAIIKLIEDKMNVEHDVNEVGVQTIILVEDSIRLYSSYLPNIYKIIFKQSKEFMLESLNEHQQMLQMRGRPKVLLATNFEEAVDLFDRYKNNCIGIISDVAFKREGKMDDVAGILLFEKIHAYDEYVPFLLHSADAKNEAIAKQYNIGFINKNSKTYSIQLHDFIIEHFAFGDFIFRDPRTHREIMRVPDLKSLQERIFEVPDESLEYHISKNHFSKWLNARALFPIAELFREYRYDDFNDLDEIRRYIFDTIAAYRLNKGRGIIADFYKDRFDEYLIFSRIGEGSIGGKARGLAFIDSLIKRNKLLDKYNDVIITIPRTVVLGTDIFDQFMEENNLHSIAVSEASDQEILEQFVKARLPFRIHEDLYAFISVINKPIAIRSSSLLEDSYYQPFAGIYSTYMIPNVQSDERLMIDQLSNAIKSVYASVFFKSSKAYMAATSNVIDEEKMGIVLQEVCGQRHGERFYPSISGVARSINFYPIAPEKPEDGIVNVALGLGKYIVDGGQTLRFSPKYPKKVLQLSSPEIALKESQKEFYALDLDARSFKTSTDDGVNILRLKVEEAEKDGATKQLVSTYDHENNILKDGDSVKGKKIITFSNILNYNSFPLADILKTILEVGQREMNVPIEIEFAADLNTPEGYPKIFNILQIRPIVENKETVHLNLDSISMDKTIIYSNQALGNGIIDRVADIVYVKPESFDPAKNRDIALHIAKINDQFIREKKGYVLIGPGRWGSSDPWLGIPVKWPQICAARVIVESGLEKYRIDPSQGTHFFQNLTSFHVGYFTINPHIQEGHYDLAYLSSCEAFYEDEFVRHIRFDKPFLIKIDGKKNIGVIFK